MDDDVEMFQMYGGSEAVKAFQVSWFNLPKISQLAEIDLKVAVALRQSVISANTIYGIESAWSYHHISHSSFRYIALDCAYPYHVYRAVNYRESNLARVPLECLLVD